MTTKPITSQNRAENANKYGNVQRRMYKQQIARCDCT